MTKQEFSQATHGALHREMADVVESTREAVARSVYVLTTATNWEIGRRVGELGQGGEGGAACGEALILRLDRGFGWRNVAQMRAFCLARPTERNLQTLSGKSPA